MTSQNNTIRRQPAIPATVKEISEGEFVTQEGWEPSYIKTSRGAMSRVHIIGTLTESDGSQQCSVDDGTGIVLVRSFEQVEQLKNITIGSVVRIIGRPRNYNQENYIMPEIITPITDMIWVGFHKELLTITQQNTSVIQEDNVEHQEQEGDELQGILERIDALDEGDGASIEKVSSALKEILKIEDPKQYIDRLLLHGEIFEIRPGMVKVLR